VCSMDHSQRKQRGVAFNDIDTTYGNVAALLPEAPPLHVHIHTHTHAPAHPRTHSRLIVLGVKKGQEGVASESRDRTVLFVRAWRTLLGIGTRRRFRLTDATYRWWRLTQSTAQE
jgi:hypothetical protein